MNSTARSRTRRPAALPATLLLAALAAAGSRAQTGERWSTERAAVDSDGQARPVAVVVSGSGDALRVYRDAAGAVQLSLRLRDGLERLWDGACPSIQVDAEPAHSPALDGESCTIDDRGARIRLGAVRDGSIVSVLLGRLMYGTEVILRFRVRGLGYRESRFSLRGSKQALVSVIGDDVILGAQ